MFVIPAKNHEIVSPFSFTKILSRTYYLTVYITKEAIFVLWECTSCLLASRQKLHTMHQYVEALH